MSILDERELGTIPISIGTALAIDGLYNRHPETKVKGKLPASLAKDIYINVRTLFRNVHGAVGDRDKADRIVPADYADTILKEIDELKSSLSNEEYPLTVIPYLPTYKSIASYMGNGELRELNTDKQKMYNSLENATLQVLFDKFKDDKSASPFKEVDMEIKSEVYQPIIIITHLPVDLLNVVNASEVYLAESHTGRVKTKDLWYTKFHSDKSPRIPFNKATLLFFGDSGGLFKPQHIKSRKRVLDIADKRKWNRAAFRASHSQPPERRKSPQRRRQRTRRNSPACPRHRQKDRAKNRAGTQGQADGHGLHADRHRSRRRQ